MVSRFIFYTKGFICRHKTQPQCVESIDRNTRGSGSALPLNGQGAFDQVIRK